MELTTIVASLVLAVLYLFYLYKRPYKYPPGPPFLPIVGNASQLKKLAKELNGVHNAVKYLAKKYNTRVLGLRLGSQLVVFVVNGDLVKEVLNNEKFNGRPDSFFNRLRTMGERRGITSVDGELWKDQRKFAVHHLKQNGFGKQTMEDELLLELQEFVDKLRLHDTCSEIGHLIAPSIVNVLWIFTAGNRIGSTDPRCERLIDILNRRSKIFDMSGAILGQMPWLRFIAPVRTGYSLIVQLNEELKDFMTEIIDEHRETHTEGRCDDLVHAFLTEIKLKEGEISPYTEEQLIIVLQDIFFGGAETVSNTLEFIFLFITMNQDIQQKVFKEIKSVLNRKLPTLTEKIKLPYTEAVLLEIHRLHHIIPINAPRRALQRTTLDGYIIPKNTIVFVNFESVLKDPVHWEDSHKFKPERWLNENGEIRQHDRFIPFGYGKRRCMGENLAKAALFLFFVGVLQEFELTVPEGTETPTLEPIPGMILSSKPYTILFKPRY